MERSGKQCAIWGFFGFQMPWFFCPTGVRCAATGRSCSFWRTIILTTPRCWPKWYGQGGRWLPTNVAFMWFFLSSCYIPCAGFSCWWRLVKRWFASRRWLELFWGRYKQRQHRARRFWIISERVLAPNNQTISGHRHFISRNCCAVERLSLQKVVIRRKDWKVNGNVTPACGLSVGNVSPSFVFEHRKRNTTSHDSLVLALRIPQRVHGRPVRLHGPVCR